MDCSGKNESVKSKHMFSRGYRNTYFDNHEIMFYSSKIYRYHIYHQAQIQSSDVFSPLHRFKQSY